MRGLGPLPRNGAGLVLALVCAGMAVCSLKRWWAGERRGWPWVGVLTLTYTLV